MTLSKSTQDVETSPLWHATQKANIDEIKKNNFDRGLSGALGELETSVKNLFCKLDLDLIKNYMLKFFENSSHIII